MLLLSRLASLAPGLTIHQPTPNPQDVGSNITIIADLAVAADSVALTPSFFPPRQRPQFLRRQYAAAETTRVVRFLDSGFRRVRARCAYAVQAQETETESPGEVSFTRSFPVHVPMDAT